MLELDARPARALCNEADLDFRFKLRIVLPVGGDVPREHEPRRRFPNEDRAPLAGASVLAALVPATTDAGLDDGIDRIDLADLVGSERPPGAHLSCEHAPRHLRGRLHIHLFLDAVRIRTARLLRHCCFLSLVASRSAARLNAT